MRITSNIKANIRQTLRDLPDGRQVYDIILDQIPSQEDEILSLIHISEPRRMRSPLLVNGISRSVTLREDGIQIADMTER